MIKKSVLKNGVRVLTEAMPAMVSSTIGIWVENGSRYEVGPQNGVSHFIEHLLFKGTKKRTAAQIAEQIDAVGGVLNAFTGKEYTCYYAKVLGEDLKMTTELLADIFLESVFAPDEIDRERLFDVIEGDGTYGPITAPSEHLMVLNHVKKLEQAHLCLGGRGVSQVDPLRYAAYVFNTALGGGMSSRLFQEVREKRGRVYSIYSFLSAFLDCGYFGIYAGTSPEWVDEVLEVTLKEVGAIIREGLKTAELARAKSQLKGNMLLGMESTDSRMNRLARNEIYFGRDIPLEEIARGIESVTNDQVVELASSCFKAERMGMVMLGDLKGRELGADVFSTLG